MKILDDEYLMWLAVKLKSEAYDRFLVNELIRRNSPLLYEYADFFSENDSTRSAYFLSVKKDECEQIKNLSSDDVHVLNDLYFNDHNVLLYEKLNRDWLMQQLRMDVSFSAHVHNTSKPFLSDFLCDAEELDYREPNKNRFIVGVTRVKNESGLPKHAIRQWLSICDHVVISDGNITSATYEGLDPACYSIIPQREDSIHESNFYDDLYSKCRSISATHIVHFDVDEVLDPSTDYESLKRKISCLQKGESLSVEWEQIFYLDKNIYKMKRSNVVSKSTFRRTLLPYKDLAFCDDGASTHLNMRIHSPNLPNGFPLKRFFSSEKLLHMEGMYPQNVLGKYNRYYELDFSINRNIELALSRYLPFLYKFLSFSSCLDSFERKNLKDNTGLMEYRRLLIEKGPPLLSGNNQFFDNFIIPNNFYQEWKLS